MGPGSDRYWASRSSVRKTSRAQELAHNFCYAEVYPFIHRYNRSN